MRKKIIAGVVTTGFFALRGVDTLIPGIQSGPKTVYPKQPQTGSAQRNPTMGGFINPLYPLATHPTQSVN